MEPGARVKVVVIGAGAAGLAAAVALAQDGASVTLLERRPFVGGRAYSYHHPALDETVDSQHVILGCCTNFIDLLTQSGAAHTIRWYDSLTFLEPRSGQPPRRSLLNPSSLPAPLHQSLSFLRAPMLTLRDKLAIATGLAHFLRGYPATDEESFATFLKRTRQTERAIRHFWEPVIVGALNDTFDNCSTRYAGKVFHESFLRSPQAGRLGIPTAPLSEFFAPVAAHACALGVDLRPNAGVTAIAPLPNNRWRIHTATDSIEADAVILATNLRQTQDLLTALATSPESVVPKIGRDFSPGTSGSTSNGALAPATCPPPAKSGISDATAAAVPASRYPEASAPSVPASRYPEASASGLPPTQKEEGAVAPGVCTPDLDKFTTAPITTIHLWYDREITPLDHAVLLDTRIQWLFNKSRIRQWEPARGSYLELVISASHAELALSREQILASALAELELFFPKVRTATLLKSAVLKEARATFSVTPGLDAHRPPQTTAYPNLFLAGDWTATNWPSTMEGAIRGGRLAAAAALSTTATVCHPERSEGPTSPHCHSERSEGPASPPCHPERSEGPASPYCHPERSEGPASPHCHPERSEGPASPLTRFLSPELPATGLMRWLARKP